MSKGSNRIQNASPNKFLIGVCLLGVLFVAIVFLRKKEALVGVTAGTNQAHAAIASLRPTPVRARATSANLEENTQEPPKNAKTAYLIEDFRDPDKPMSNYKMTNLKVGLDGITLSDGATSGVLESPPLVFKQPSNMVAPLWKKEGPDCTSIRMEVAITADNQTWSPWYPVEDTGADVNPISPDGSPNPDYGYVSGSSVSTGLSLSSFTKYRVTITKSDQCPQAPVLKVVRLYHIDSTLGEGKTENVFPPGPGEPQPAEEASNEIPNHPAKP